MRILVFLLFFVFYSHSAFAVKQEMPEVIVKAAKGGTSLTVPNYDAAVTAANRAAGGTAVVNAEHYKTGRASTLQDTLGYTAGVYVQPRFGSEESRLSIRGSGIQRTFHLRGIKLLQDGIPINQADGGGDFQALEPLALQYVEVYRGANAMQYGATTLGGAINFVSPTGYDAPLVQGRFEAGGFGYLREQVSSGAVQGPADYFVSLSETRQDGFRNQSEQWNKRLFSNYGVRINGNVETRIYVNLVDSKSKLPGSLTRGQMKQNPQQPNPANLSGNHKRDFDLVQIASKTSAQWGDEKIEFGTTYVHKDLFHPIFQVIDQVSHDLGGFLRYLNEKDLLNHRNAFTLGFNPVWGMTDAAQYVNLGGERGARTFEAKQTSYNLDLYAEEQFYVTENLAAVGGFQWSYASRKTRDKFLSDGNHSGHPTYIGLSPKAGVRYEFTETEQVFANISRSFEPPSFAELSNVTSGGIRDLTEQLATTMEIGTRGNRGRFGWDLAWYYSWVDNELLSLNDGSGNPLGTVNAYDTHHHGIELGLRADLLRGLFFEDENGTTSQKPGFTLKEDFFGQPDTVEGEDRVMLRGIYNWSEFAFENDPAFSDNPLPGIPSHFIRMELLYEHPRGFYFGPNLEWTPVEYAVDMNQTLFTYPFALMGIKGGYRMKNGLSFFVEAKNLTNETYAATTGVINNANGQDSAQFLPGDGRTIITGIEFKWG
jgi:iron complex outermembrane recepter protein